MVRSLGQCGSLFSGFHKLQKSGNCEFKFFFCFYN
jgi:hypothetical protein